MRKPALLLLLLFSFTSTFAQVSGDVPNKDRIDAYVKAFNSGDEAMAAFIRDNVSEAALQRTPAAERLKIYGQMHQRLKTIELKGFPGVEVSASEMSVTARVKSSAGEMADITFLFEPAAPNKLIALKVEDVDAEGGDSASPRLTQAEFTKKAADFLDDASRKDEFSGAVLVAKNGNVIFEKAYGLADKQKNIPNKVSTKFNLGSINKIFTRTCIDGLVSQGNLAYTDKLGKFLPDYPNKDAREKVTIAQLLTMRSGIGDFFGEKFDSTPKTKLRSLRDYLSLFADQPLLFEPGSKSQYSNGGYVVLGLIIEKVSGQDYYSYVKQHVFDVAGMKDTESYFSSQNVPDRADGYTTEGSSDGARHNNASTRPERGSSAGGGYSTLHDMLDFTKALTDGKLIMYSPETGKPVRGAMGIAGGAPGINAALDFDPQSGTTIIVLANYDAPAAMRVASQLRQWMKGL